MFLIAAVLDVNSNKVLFASFFSYTLDFLFLIFAFSSPAVL